MAVAAILAADESLAGRPALLPDGRKIDFVVDRDADNLYIEVKTLRPNMVDSDEAWADFLRRLASAVAKRFSHSQADCCQKVGIPSKRSLLIAEVI
jgi:hypothetical protein